MFEMEDASESKAGEKNRFGVSGSFKGMELGHECSYAAEAIRVQQHAKGRGIGGTRREARSKADAEVNCLASAGTEAQQTMKRRILRGCAVARRTFPVE